MVEPQDGPSPGDWGTGRRVVVCQWRPWSRPDPSRPDPGGTAPPWRPRALPGAGPSETEASRAGPRRPDGGGTGPAGLRGALARGLGPLLLPGTGPEVLGDHRGVLRRGGLDLACLGVGGGRDVSGDGTPVVQGAPSERRAGVGKGWVETS